MNNTCMHYIITVFLEKSRGELGDL